MADLAIICIFIGVLIIVARGPLIFWPDATREVYIKMVGTRFRVRLLGIFQLGLALTVLFFVQSRPGVAFAIITGFCVVWAALVLLILLIFPSIGKTIAEAFIEAMDNLTLRTLGVLGSGLGILFIWLGMKMLA